MQVTVARENSFEDLEQFLTQLDWTVPHGSTDVTNSESELTCDASLQAEQNEGNIQGMEMTALAAHLKAIVKDIHNAIGKHDDTGNMSLCLHMFYSLLY